MHALRRDGGREQEETSTCKHDRGGLMQWHSAYVYLSVNAPLIAMYYHTVYKPHTTHNLLIHSNERDKELEISVFQFFTVVN